MVGLDGGPIHAIERGEGMVSNWQQEYADALDEVERRRKSGQLTEGEALAWKQRLITEMDSQFRPTFARIGNRWPTFARIGNRLMMAVIVLLVVLALLSFIF
jgi:cytochrome c-type biogenesis protein CcmH/NrfG